MNVVEDPVCGMEFTEEEAQTLGAEEATHGGSTYYLCSPACLEAFEEDPDAYVDGA